MLNGDACVYDFVAHVTIVSVTGQMHDIQMDDD